MNAWIATLLILSVHVCNEEDYTEHDAKGAYNDIADCKEIVLSAKNVRRWNHEVFVTTEGAHIVIVLDLDVVSAWL